MIPNDYTIRTRVRFPPPLSVRDLRFAEAPALDRTSLALGCRGEISDSPGQDRVPRTSVSEIEDPARPSHSLL